MGMVSGETQAKEIATEKLDYQSIFCCQEPINRLGLELQFKTTVHLSQKQRFSIRFGDISHDYYINDLIWQRAKDTCLLLKYNFMKCIEMENTNFPLNFIIPPNKAGLFSEHCKDVITFGFFCNIFHV